MTMEATEAPPAERGPWMTTPPQDWAGWLALQAEVNRNKAARESLRNFLSEHVDAESDHLRHGLGLFAAGEPAAALPHLQACTDDLSKLLSGIALDRAGQTSAAVECLADLLGSPAIGHRARHEHLALLCKTSDLDGANTALDAMRGAGSSPADVAYAEGLIAEAGADHEGAMACWRIALQHEPSHEEARFRLAYRTDLEGNDDEALELYRGSLDSEQPVHIGTLMNLGVLYEDSEQYDAAARCYRAVLAADPRNTRARRYLADAEASRRQYYDETRERKADMQNAVLRIPVTDFELSVRARNCLQRMNIHTLGDLISRTESELLSFKNFGETSLQEVKEILHPKGLRLGMVPPKAGEEPLVDLGEVAPTSEVGEVDPADVGSRPISALDLSVRSRAALITLGITTVGNLTETSEDTLLACKNFGQTSLVEIKTKLSELGLSLGK
jgi:DNA-directed RNA polymerase subunit alpha